MAASEEEQAAGTESTISPRLSWTLFGQFNILESINQLFWNQLVALVGERVAVGAEQQLLRLELLSLLHHSIEPVDLVLQAVHRQLGWKVESGICSQFFLLTIII
jgi:hypothetical protein